MRLISWQLAVIILFLSGLSCSVDSPVQLADNPTKPAGNVDAALLELAAEFERFVESGGEEADFVSPESAAQVAGGYVVTDSTASEAGEKLAQDLVAIGAVDVQAFGMVVSCRLPLSAIREVVKLKSLRYMRASPATTR